MIKIVGFFLFYLTIASILAQTNEVSSIYFSKPSEIQVLTEFPQYTIGEYKLKKDTLTKLLVSPQGMVLRYFFMTSIPMKKIKNMDKYLLRDDKIFGIDKNRGLPYEIHTDTLYTVLIQNEDFFKIDENHSLDQLDDNTFLLNYKIDDNHYYIEVFKVIDGEVIIYSLDHDPVLTEIQASISTEEEQFEGILTYKLLPVKKNILKLLELNAFSDEVSYVKS